MSHSASTSRKKITINLQISVKSSDSKFQFWSDQNEFPFALRTDDHHDIFLRIVTHIEEMDPQYVQRVIRRCIASFCPGYDESVLCQKYNNHRNQSICLRIISWFSLQFLLHPNGNRWSCYVNPPRLSSFYTSAQRSGPIAGNLQLHSYMALKSQAWRFPCSSELMMLFKSWSAL